MKDMSTLGEVGEVGEVGNRLVEVEAEAGNEDSA